MLEGKMHHTQSASKSSFKVGQCLVKTCFLVAFCFCNCLNSFCHPSWGCGKEGKSNHGCHGLHFFGGPYQPVSLLSCKRFSLQLCIYHDLYLSIFSYIYMLHAHSPITDTVHRLLVSRLESIMLLNLPIILCRNSF